MNFWKEEVKIIYKGLRDNGFIKFSDLINEWKEQKEKLEKIDRYLDKQRDIPIELLVNIKNIIHSDSRSDKE